ncbi:hypothetical protein [Arthrobacter sp. SLBN-100]|uniref:hypothetical protein n=1 Tax=Arthrobacter sp. SLBN-100 TaxID=2768450 RepID=UPI00114F754D|nr:hypothetical protein [Arthrobacter sp. SLBN-100]
MPTPPANVFQRATTWAVMLDGSSISREDMDNFEKAVWTGMAAIFVGLAGAFLKSAWDDAEKQAEEAANPHIRWTDGTRWEK